MLHIDGRCQECNHLSQNQKETDLTEEEIRQIEINNKKYNDRVRLLSNATDEQYLKAFDTARPYLEKLLMRYVSTQSLN